MATLSERLRQARERSGLTQKEVAGALGFRSPATVSQYERGERTPDALTLERLARLYGVSLGFLFGEEARRDWEEALGALGREAPEARPGLAQLAHRLRAMAWLRERVEPHYRPRRSEYAPLGEEASLEEAAWRAEGVRRALGLGLSPLPDPKAFLEDQGVHVFALDLGEGVSGLFLDHPELGPVVAYNAAQAFTRRPFTLLHEFAHTRFHHDRGGILCRTESRLPRERFADLFAAHFLLPRTALVAWLEERGRKRVGTPEEAVHLAQRFGVSYALVLRRLEEEGLLGGRREEFREAKPLRLALFLGYPVPPQALGQAPLPLAERLPRKLLEWALRGVDRGQISLSRAAEALGVSDLELEELLEARFPESAGAA